MKIFVKIVEGFASHEGWLFVLQWSREVILADLSCTRSTCWKILCYKFLLICHALQILADLMLNIFYDILIKILFVYIFILI